VEDVEGQEEGALCDVAPTVLAVLALMVYRLLFFHFLWVGVGTDVVGLYFYRVFTNVSDFVTYWSQPGTNTDGVRRYDWEIVDRISNASHVFCWDV